MIACVFFPKARETREGMKKNGKGEGGGREKRNLPSFLSPPSAPSLRTLSFTSRARLERKRQTQALIVIREVLLLKFMVIVSVFTQMADFKKMADDRSALLEEAEQARKKMMRDIETFQGRVDELSANNSKLEKTRKRLQDEVHSSAYFPCAMKGHKYFFRGLQVEGEVSWDFLPLLLKIVK